MGRRTDRATLRAGARSVLGIDLGATKVVGVLLGPRGTLLHGGAHRFHGNEGLESVVASTVETASETMARFGTPPVGVGVGVAAQVDPRTGVVVHAPNLGWRDVPLARLLARQLRLPVRLSNDAQAAACAEWKFGAGRGTDDLFLMCVGTGVGGAAVVDGRRVFGSHSAAGEVGHLTLVSGGRRCHCGNEGCLEAYAGGWAVGERAREAVQKSPRRGKPMARLAGSADRITARTVFEAARAGDRLAHQVAKDTERYLADGAVGVVNAFNPEVLVLVGGMLHGWPGLLSAVREAVRTRCQPPARGVKVVRGSLGGYATAIGAAEVASETWRSAPSTRSSEGSGPRLQWDRVSPAALGTRRSRGARPPGRVR